MVGRFSTIDPLAEDFEHVSPYNYALNNPVLMVDEFGMAADTTKKINPTPKPEPKPVELKEVKVSAKGWRWPTWSFTIPVIGAAAQSGNNLSDGNYGISALKFGQSLLELFTFGYSYEAKAGATVATDVGTTVYISTNSEGVT